MFTCSLCRCKGTLARRLQQAEAVLDSTKVQLGMYKQLLDDKQRQIDRVTGTGDSDDELEGGKAE